MVDAAAQLREAARALQTDVFGQFAWLATHGDAQLLRGTWSIWQPSLPLTADGVAFALVAGVAAWLAFLLGWLAIAAAVRRARGVPLRTARR
jgi:hypothetical protein